MDRKHIVTVLKLDPDDATTGSGVSIDFNASTTNTGASFSSSRIVGARQGGNASGFLALYTSPDTSGSVPLERMRISDSGSVRNRSSIQLILQTWRLLELKVTSGSMLNFENSSRRTGAFKCCLLRLQTMTSKVVLSQIMQRLMRIDSSGNVSGTSPQEIYMLNRLTQVVLHYDGADDLIESNANGGITIALQPLTQVKLFLLRLMMQQVVKYYLTKLVL